jgi:hypothetical protein
MSITDALVRQHAALREKRQRLDRALDAVAEARNASELGQSTEVLLRRVIEAIEMTSDSNWMMNYYSPAAQARLAERAKLLTPEAHAQVAQDWKDYYRDLADLMENGDPSGARRSELADRNKELLSRFTGNDPEIEAGLLALYRDRANWPSDLSDRLKQFEEPGTTKPRTDWTMT